MSEIELFKNGKRLDGRKELELRRIDMKTNIISRADGSAEVSFGNTRCIAAVYGPKTLHPKHLQDPERSILRCRYNMAPFSVDERKSPGPDRRSIELSKVIREAVEASIFLEDFPRAEIDIYVEVLDADGSTRVTCTNAASLALAQAGIPMKDLVCAVSCGKIDGKLVLDLSGIEDNYGEADMSFGILPSKDEVSLLQMDGLLKKDEIVEILNKAKEACFKIYEMQKNVLYSNYKKVEE